MEIPICPHEFTQSSETHLAKTWNPLRFCSRRWSCCEIEISSCPKITEQFLMQIVALLWIMIWLRFPCAKTLPVYFKLFRSQDFYRSPQIRPQIHQIHDCDEDKALRKSIFNHIVRDIAHMNQKTKNQKDPSSALREGQSSIAELELLRSTMSFETSSSRIWRKQTQRPCWNMFGLFPLKSDVPCDLLLWDLSSLLEGLSTCLCGIHHNVTLLHESGKVTQWKGEGRVGESQHMISFVFLCWPPWEFARYRQNVDASESRCWAVFLVWQKKLASLFEVWSDTHVVNLMSAWLGM